MTSRQVSGQEYAPPVADAPVAPSSRRIRAKALLRPLLPLFSAFRRYLNAPLENRFREVEGRLTVSARSEALQLTARLEQHDVRINGVAEQAARLESRLDQIGAKLTVIQTDESARSAAFADQNARLLSLMADLRDLVSTFGGRFDEIEVKIRQTLDFDDAYAIRLGDGYVLAPKNEMAFVLMLADATTGGLEPGTRRCIQRILDPGMRAIDVGANIGLHTLACARAVGASGKVYSFEPEDRIADLLQRTLALNGLSWVEVHRQAAGERPEEKSFYLSAVPGHSSLYPLPAEEAAATRTVKVVRLDDVIADGQKIDLVKIDAEGAEIDVLRGMRRLARQNEDIAVIAEYGPSHLARTGVDANEWFSAFADLGFVAYAITEPFGVCEATSQDELAEIVSVNLAFVRPGRRAETRLVQGGGYVGRGRGGRSS